MGILGNLFGNGYNDEEIVMETERIVAQDPVLNNPGRVGVTSQDGIITLSGMVNSDREKIHIEDLISSSLNNSNLKYERVENQLRVG